MASPSSSLPRELAAALPLLDHFHEAVALLRVEAADAHIVYANPGFADLTGLGDPTRGWTLGQLLPSPGDAAKLKAALAGGRALRFQVTLSRCDGSELPVELSLSPLPRSRAARPWFLLALHDLTEFRKTVRELSAERDRYLGFLEHAPLGILALDSVVNGIVIADARSAQRPIVYANAAFERLSGYTTEELLGRDIGRLNSLEPGPAEQQLGEALAAARECRVEFQYQRKDGAWFWDELAVYPIFDGHGQLTHFLGIHSDVTERHRIQSELKRLTTELQRNRDDLLSILDQLPSATLIIDADDHVVFASATSRGILARHPETLVGQNWREALGLGREAVLELARNSRLPAAERARCTVETRNGGEVRCLDCQIRDDPRDASRRLFFFDDVTEVQRLRQALESGRHGAMIGASDCMRRLYRLIGEVAQGDWTVLIEGETGTGKELVARAIHDSSPRRNGPFIAVNSAGLSESLLMSQLFGHRRGAFTGATQDQKGYFEAAEGGTLFLDEIGDLPLAMQASLLRVLQEREVTRLGETLPRKVDVRVIAATHRNLALETRAGHFREDLLFRLRVARLTVPPLRERKTDIPLLAEQFLRTAGAQGPKLVEGFEPAAMRRMLEYDWPGNVRELKACVEYAVVYSQAARIGVLDLPPELQSPVAAASTLPRENLLPEGDERSRIRAALEQTRGNCSKAAQLLGISRATFYRRLEQLGLKREA